MRFRALVAALAVALSACLIAGVATSGAADVGQLQGQIGAARQRAQSLAAIVQSSQEKLSIVAARAQAAAQREAGLSALLAEGRERSAALGARVAASESELRDARQRMHRATAVLARRLVEIYKGGAPDSVSMVLSADGFDDLITRSEYLQLIESSDSDLARRVRALRDRVSVQLAVLQRARAAAEAYNARVDAARAQIASARAAAEAQAAAYAQARAAAAGSLGALQGQIGNWEAQLQRAQRISAVQARQQVGRWVGDYSIPNAIVMCESGGNYRAVNGSSGAGGAYQIIPSTWRMYGGKGRPQDGSKAEQDRIAAAIWRDSGSGAWVCAQ
jgi:peptidoglycan hydrolase CwlO-like protein